MLYILGELRIKFNTLVHQIVIIGILKLKKRCRNGSSTHLIRIQWLSKYFHKFMKCLNCSVEVRYLRPTDTCENPFPHVRSHDLFYLSSLLSNPFS